MPYYAETKHFDYSCHQLFELVADVESYPQFLPWCKATRITERYDDYFIAEMVICFKQITESYVSKVKLQPPEALQGECRIDVELIKGPFRHLANHWHFTAEGTGCQVNFSVDFQFRIPMLEKVIGPLFARASEKMVGAFSDRANTLYTSTSA